MNVCFSLRADVTILCMHAALIDGESPNIPCMSKHVTTASLPAPD